MIRSRRLIAALLGALAIAAPRLLTEWLELDDLRQAARIGLARDPAFPAAALVVSLLGGALAAVLVSRKGRRGLALVGLIVLAHAVGDVAVRARRIDRHAIHSDIVAHLEAPDGSALAGARLLAARGRAPELVWPFAALGLVAIGFFMLRSEAAGELSLKPQLAFGLALGSTGLSLLAVSLWSQGVLPRDGRLADELVVIGHGLALAFALKAGPRRLHQRSLAALIVVFGAFALGFGFVHQWKPTRSLCMVAASNSYDRATRERALARARARLRSPVAWLPSLFLPVRRECDAAAQGLGL